MIQKSNFSLHNKTGSDVFIAATTMAVRPDAGTSARFPLMSAKFRFMSDGPQLRQ